ncbi:MAG: class I SAM-dependent methyltransferase [Candidatus Puniceispirillaceae bacterium]
MKRRIPVSFRIFSSFITCGSLQIKLATPSVFSESLYKKGTKDGPDVTIQLQDLSDLRKITLTPQLAIPEAYMTGRLTLIDTSLEDFMIFLFCNKQSYHNTLIGRIEHHLSDMLALLKGKIARGRAKKNVAHHYDLTDALYECFLGETRQYSCAYFKEDSDDIDLAQRQKMAHIAAKLKLKDGGQILDIGCGWGELAYHLSLLKEKLSVKGITLSENQLAYCNRHIIPRAQNLQFELKDYRDEKGHYDHIVSVGMLEHVGRQSYQQFFDQISHCLKQDGTALIHTIGKRRACRTTTPFIRKYIFPGGYIPTLADLSNALAKTDLHIGDIECLHNHYAQTLRHWRMACEAKKETLINLYDEEFYRMWRFYLASCEYFFRLDEGVVYQIQLFKTRDKTPNIRDYIALKEQDYLEILCQTNHFGKQ